MIDIQRVSLEFEGYIYVELFRFSEWAFYLDYPIAYNDILRVKHFILTPFFGVQNETDGIFRMKRFILD